MQTILVEVRHGGATVDQRERPLRRVPDGGIGVIYQGVVYPLTTERCIDLAGRWFYPSDCPVLLDPPPECQFGGLSTERATWHLDTSGFYSYVFVNGSQVFHDTARRALETAGFRVSRSGRTFREADDGVTYDWYLRLEVEGERRPSNWEIDQALSGLLAAEPEKAGQEDVGTGTEVSDVDFASASSAVRRQLTEWQARVSVSERQLAEREHEVASLKLELERGRESQARKQTLLKDQMALLRGAISEYRRLASLPNPNDAPAKEDARRMTEQLASIEEERNRQNLAVQALAKDLERAMDEWDKADREAANARGEVDLLKGQVEDLQSALAASQRAADRESEANLRSSARKNHVKDLEVTMEVLLPELRLIAGSLEFIAHEVFDRRNLLTALHLLGRDPAAVQSKRVQGAAGWLERHFNTGQSNDGRLYFRKAKESAASAVYDILVSDKHNQPRDLRRLKDL